MSRRDLWHQELGEDYEKRQDIFGETFLLEELQEQQTAHSMTWNKFIRKDLGVRKLQVSPWGYALKKQSPVQEDFAKWEIRGSLNGK